VQEELTSDRTVLDDRSGLSWTLPSEPPEVTPALTEALLAIIRKLTQEDFDDTAA